MKLINQKRFKELFHQVSLQKGKIKKIEREINQIKQIRSCEKLWC